MLHSVAFGRSGQSGRVWVERRGGNWVKAATFGWRGAGKIGSKRAHQAFYNQNEKGGEEVKQ